jgi:hypothetical protein
MKTLITILIALTLLTTISCSKKSTVSIQAHNLVNPAEGSHYANKRFVITEITYKLFGQSKGKTVVDSYFDNNGHANFELKMKKNKDYMIDVEQLDNICYLDLRTDDFLDHSSTVDINFNYAPCGYVNVPTNNINCEGTTDKLWYKYYYKENTEIYLYRGFTGVGDTGWDQNAGTQGCVNYIGDFYDKVPAGNYTFEWHIERPSGVIDGTDYFTVTEGDTTTYILEY